MHMLPIKVIFGDQCTKTSHFHSKAKRQHDSAAAQQRTDIMGERPRPAIVSWIHGRTLFLHRANNPTWHMYHMLQVPVGCNGVVCPQGKALVKLDMIEVSCCRPLDTSTLLGSQCPMHCPMHAGISSRKKLFQKVMCCCSFNTHVHRCHVWAYVLIGTIQSIFSFIMKWF